MYYNIMVNYENCRIPITAESPLSTRKACFNRDYS